MIGDLLRHWTNPSAKARVTAPEPQAVAGLSGKDLLAWPFNTDAEVLGDRLSRNTAVITMLIDLTGLDWTQIDPLLPLIRTTAAEKDMVPVLVVDLADIVSVRRSGLAYDALPNAAANAHLAPNQDWPAYVARCRQLLAQKWRPGAIVHLGTRAEW
jgi:hypothetical protein